MYTVSRLYLDRLVFDLPDLVALQTDSYSKFLSYNDASRLSELFRLAFPVSDSYGRADLEFVSCKVGKPNHDQYDCVIRGVTYSVPLLAVLRLVVWEGAEDDQASDKSPEDASKKEPKDIREQEIYMGDIPMMTDDGTFVINGVERVVVSQVHRAPGAFFDHDSGRSLQSKLSYIARIIPYRGSWLDFEFDYKNILYFRIDKKRKLPVTYLLRALGLSNHDIFTRFYDALSLDYCDIKDGVSGWVANFDPSNFKGIRLQYDLVDADSGATLLKKGSRVSPILAEKFSRNGLKRYVLPFDSLLGFYLAEDVKSNSGEIIASYGCKIDVTHLSRFRVLGIKKLTVLNVTNDIIVNVVAQNDCTYEDALFSIYRVVRPGEVPSLDSAEKLFNSLFFDSDRYDLLSVGRVRINAKFNLPYPDDLTVLTRDDILCTIDYLLLLQSGNGDVDDIDHLGNRRVRSVGEFIDNQFRIGLARMTKVIAENMMTADFDSVTPSDLVNSKILIAVIREFFVSSTLSQFMDQTNPLSEITHKRRLSALGPGGLNRGRAGFEVRDVHTTHYGRLCATETPEGTSIGLINSLAIYAKINKHGFIETPYRKVESGKITDEVVYLSAIEESKYNICQANVDLSEDGVILGSTVHCRKNYENVFVSREDVEFADVSPSQITSVAASLIPFLENNDANRALMGSNMQRQAVPLLKPQSPLVGTGMESYVALGSGAMLLAKRTGIVEYADSQNIIIRSEDPDDVWFDSYKLRKFSKSNHGTCMHQKLSICRGDKVKKGSVIADGPATENGDLALGANMLVAFLSWRGYNFEDSILVSSNVVRDDALTSIHMEEFECIVRDTRLGPEEITRDIPGVGEEFLRHLDEFGIVHVGARVGSGDVLVGKVTPKSASPVTPEEKLLRAIFGEKAIDVKDSSLCLPPGASGCVMDVRVFQRRGTEKLGRSLLIEKEMIEQERLKSVRESEVVSNCIYSVLREKLAGKKALNSTRDIKTGEIVTSDLLDRIDKKLWWDINVGYDNSALRKCLESKVAQIKSDYEDAVEKIKAHDELMQGVVCIVKVFVAIKHTLQPGDKMSGRHGNKGVISRVVPAEDMPYLSDGTPVDIVLNPLGVPSRMNVGQILETHIGWASYNLGKKIAKLLDSKSISELKNLLLEIYKNDKYFNGLLSQMGDDEIEAYAAGLRKGVPIAASVFNSPRKDEIERLLSLAGVDPSGQEVLYDGVTGEPLDRKVTVGYKYMLKLHHLVNDKIHARSIGPYSLITQQPLGGKSHFGGQRFGEMECWALQAHGATFALQEMLTIKSDDVVGRVNVYESIVKGENNFYYGTPESFNVMMNEIRGLCLDIHFDHSSSDDENKDSENIIFDSSDDYSDAEGGVVIS
jgi:DNA-directed RNA polymerase subunit beta